MIYSLRHPAPATADNPVPHPPTRRIVELGFFVSSLLAAPSLLQLRDTTPIAEPAKQNKEGDFDFRNDLTVARKNEKLATMRALLWEDFVLHRISEVRATFYTLEGDPTHYTFVVAPFDGKWCIHSESVSTIASGLPAGQRARTKKKVIIYCDIERIDAETDRVVPNSEQRNPNTYLLRLKSSSEASILTL